MKIVVHVLPGLVNETNICYTNIILIIKETNSMNYTYTPTGVCSSRIDLELEDGVIRSVSFTGGCNGNLKGICSLVKDMPAQEAIAKLQGIQCGWKPTSCPDQLSKALTEALEKDK